tara:strand:+ start:144 stop:344 length:201 start_codon:yes stop_codon:yes gene_type:complete
MKGAFYDSQEKQLIDTNQIKAKVYAENLMKNYRKMLRIVEYNFGTATAKEYRKLVINKFKDLKQNE